MTSGLLAYIVPPLVGGVIGYVTNYLAIRMMLRPHEAHYVGKWRIPFTPGIIPKEKPRIAKAIGGAVANHLMNEEVLKRNLLSGDMLGRVGEGVDAYLKGQAADGKTLREFLLQYFDEKDLTVLVDRLTSEACRTFSSGISEAGLGKRIAQLAVQHGIGKVSSGALGTLGVDKLLQPVLGKVESLLAVHVEEFIAKHSGDLIAEILGGEKERLLNVSLSSLLAEPEKVGQLRQNAVSLYSHFVETHLPQVLRTIDISAIVETRINEMDMVEAEGIIMSVINKELQALCLLGAVLGAAIGCVNILFSL